MTQKWGIIQKVNRVGWDRLMSREFFLICSRILGWMDENNICFKFGIYFLSPTQVYSFKTVHNFDYDTLAPPLSDMGWARLGAFQRVLQSYQHFLLTRCNGFFSTYCWFWASFTFTRFCLFVMVFVYWIFFCFVCIFIQYILEYNIC